MKDAIKYWKNIVMEEIAANTITYLTFSLCKVPVFIHELFTHEFISAVTYSFKHVKS